MVYVKHVLLDQFHFHLGQLLVQLVLVVMDHLLHLHVLFVVMDFILQMVHHVNLVHLMNIQQVVLVIVLFVDQVMK